MTDIDISDEGYKDLSKFSDEVSDKQKRLLTIRFLSQDINEKVLHDTVFQKKIITNSLAIAKRYGFNGVVLDLEYKALAFDEVVKSVTNFSTNFSQQAHRERLSFYQAIYGDTFYRVRPFDVAAIGKVSDGIFVMAYNFHKANGNPGPNFPLNKLSDEDYTFQEMVHDFRSKIPVKKLTIVFGMFGYDWTVDSKGQSIGQAESLTTNQVLQKFLGHCDFSMCTIGQNNALETKITYVDFKHQKHIVWFEDLTSIEDKKDVLSSEGITAVGYWAYGYF